MDYKQKIDAHYKRVWAEYEAHLAGRDVLDYAGMPKLYSAFLLKDVCDSLGVALDGHGVSG